jgi:parallel beta-helix repeat protein
MSTSRMALIALLLVIGTAFAVPAAGQVVVNCSPEWSSPCCVKTNWNNASSFSSITGALNSAPLGLSGGTVFVSGVCAEPEGFITERFSNITLLGNAMPGTQATLQATDPSNLLGGAMTIRGRNITIRGFKITPAGALYGVDVSRGGTALIDRCEIEGFGKEGIGVIQHSFARIVNTTVRNNGGEGIVVHENSAARVGFTSADDTVPQGNTIQNNALGGVRVNRTSSARIANNVITGNGDSGVVVENNSHADVASNELSGNNGAGIRVHLNSSARVGTGIGKAEWNVPNWTTAPNFGSGLECTLGGAVEGTLGTLTGEHGPQKFGQGCMHDFTR